MLFDLPELCMCQIYKFYIFFNMCFFMLATLPHFNEWGEEIFAPGEVILSPALSTSLQTL